MYLFCLPFMFHQPDFKLAELARWPGILTTAACSAYCPCSFEVKALAGWSCLSWTCFWEEKCQEEVKDR